ncbi:MAG TPA: phosphatase PAP2 family protein [Egibacteraceae bacterium]|nr:phosphatase PAP2 family protein [Egibacteraceae bacterium]
MWLLAGFLALTAVGAATAVVVTGAAPVWANGVPVDGAASLESLDLTPQTETLAPDEVAVDAAVASWLAQRRRGWLLGAATFAAHAAKIWVTAPIVVVVGVVVWRRTGRVSALWLPALALVGGLALSVAVKFLVFRPRPPAEVAAVDAFGPSYPSGHVIRAAAVYGALAWLVAVTTTRRRRQAAAWGVAAALVAVVAAARVYEGAHWVTDVLASLLLGVGWLVVILGASGVLRRPR